jgi:Ca-activated chloride channel family protein
MENSTGASNNKALEEIFNEINTYEKAKITEIRFLDTKDYYQVYLRWAIVFFLLWLFTKSTFINNSLED